MYAANGAKEEEIYERIYRFIRGLLIVNSIEVEDVVSTHLCYTWTKNLFKTKMGDSTHVYDEEIKEATFQIDGNKAPRPDAFSSLFFKKVCDIVGDNVCSAITEFFAIGKMLREINSTLISLIPKIQTLDKVIDFKPIACCNELLKGCDRKDGPNRVAMKIDIQKVYDTVNWKFLKGGRGLRQGDPMSRYLFTLVMEVMSLIVQDKGERNKEFGYHFGCKQMKLTHVCFVDDLLTFCQDINKFLKGFLWNQVELSRGKAKLEEWISKYPRLALHHRIVLDTDKEDTIVWRSKSGKYGSSEVIPSSKRTKIKCL
uniref:Uncharacterized protein n=1 Tax=Tanacetum cinerariifolium TaxID=118510 RepID=A0A6L2JCF4_TANCI|nr:hypothetical protein [Tanacetum cinerariifolium]